jgi:hypothetical protein
MPGAPSGALGADLLAHFEVELDFPAHVLTLYQLPKGCTQLALPWFGPYDTTPADYDPHLEALHVPVEVDGQRFSALIDTGSSLASISRTALQRIGIDTGDLANDPGSITHGAKGAGIETHQHRFGRIRIGGTVFRNAHLFVEDATYLTGTDILLGMNFLRWRKVWISYSTRQLFFQLVPTAAAAGDSSQSSAR